MARKPIRVLIVEDSPVARVLLQRAIASGTDTVVAGTARSGEEALGAIQQLDPDVICTDLHMPRMNGLELTKAVMADRPRPILVISTSVKDDDPKNIFALLEAGAVDIFPKPEIATPTQYEAIRLRLLEKIRVLAGVRVIAARRAPGQQDRTASPQKLSPQPQSSPSPARSVPPAGERGRPRLSLSPAGQIIPVPAIQRKPDLQAIALGASTGGPQALQTLLSRFPENFPLPMFCVQHISEGFLDGLVRWLDGTCAVTVRVAHAGERPRSGTVYFAPERRHLDFDRQGHIQLTSAPPTNGHRPSVDVLMQALARVYGRRGLGILLTGMGCDGAEGMQAIDQAGGLTIAQDESSSVIFGMPKAAIALGAARYVLPLDRIAPTTIGRLLFNSSRA